EYKSAKDVGKEIGISAATNALSVAGGAAGGAATEAFKGFTGELIKTGINSAVGIATKASVTGIQTGSWDAVRRDFNSFNDWSGIISSAAGSIVTASLGAANLGVGNVKVMGFSSAQIGNISSLNSLVGGLTSSAITYGFTGEATFNVLNTADLGLGVNCGLLEMTVGNNGLSSRIGTGGTDISFGTLKSAASGVAHLDKNRQINKTAESYNTASAMRSLYGFGDAKQQKLLDDFISGKAQLHTGGTDGQAQTVAQDGIRHIYLNQAESADWKLAGITLGHEAYRDGLDNGEAGQKTETRTAVKKHTDMMTRMMKDSLYKDAMKELVDGNKNLQSDLIAKALGGEIFDRYVDKAYDSSADYWKLMNDGTLVQDKDGWLRDENGNFILDKDGNKIGDVNQETGLLNILFAKQEDGSYKNPGKKYDDFTDEQKAISNHIMTDAGISYYYKDPSEMGIENTKWNNDGKALNMDLVMGYAGNTIATSVFMNYFDETTNKMIDGVLSIPTAISNYVESGYLGRLFDYYSKKNDFYNGVRKLFDDYSAVTWTQDMGKPDESTASIYSQHKGGDMTAKEGTAVYAYYSGKVDNNYSGSKTAGNSIKILYGFDFEGSFYSTGVVGQFMHFAEKPTLNKYLSATSQVGKMGHTGLVSGTPGTHLHYQLIGDLQGTKKDSSSWKMLEARRNYFLNKIGSSSKGTYITGEGYNTYYYDVNFLQKKLNIKRGK
ncbi:MAG: peptidoglycan DD-metalloendopeptidase family protein, partial [Lachnospiraceae bacterium]|nr:peptidoglycan DD-metalloendopeptidase family protein [Lachnospiraceae bacterium]